MTQKKYSGKSFRHTAIYKIYSSPRQGDTTRLYTKEDWTIEFCSLMYHYYKVENKGSVFEDVGCVPINSPYDFVVQRTSAFNVKSVIESSV